MLKPKKILKPKMTDQEYIYKGGNACPFCRSTDVEAGSIDIDGATCIQEVWCSECEEGWTDIYKLTGYIQ
jgi:hypothetical protein